MHPVTFEGVGSREDIEQAELALTQFHLSGSFQTCRSSARQLRLLSRHSVASVKSRPSPNPARGNRWIRPAKSWAPQPGPSLLSTLMVARRSDFNSEAGICRKAIALKDVGDDLKVSVVAQNSGGAPRHRGLYSLKVGCRGLPAPVPHEDVALQRAPEPGPKGPERGNGYSSPRKRCGPSGLSIRYRRPARPFLFPGLPPGQVFPAPQKRKTE